jgi:DNA-binding protein
MKARKRAKFNALVFEVVEYLKNRFQVDVKDVKVAIENLITRELSASSCLISVAHLSLSLSLSLPLARC